MKKWILGSLLLCTSLISQAGIIIGDITGADLAGSEVTVTFGNGQSETQTWLATSNDSGGVNGIDWSLELSGNTFGDYDQSTNTFYGEWTLKNLSAASGIVGLSVNTGVANVFFDTLAGAEGTVGSGPGRPFAASLNNVSADFTEPYSLPALDLFGQLDILWDPSTYLGVNTDLVFLTDTDMEVPEPSALLVFAIAVFGLSRFRKTL